MAISKRCEYALRALIDLGLARAANRERVPLGEIAAHERIPPRFLEQILRQLRDAGLVDSHRGKQGGYSITETALDTPAGDVVRLVDGPLAPIRCVSETAYEPCSCPDEDHCGLRLLMTDVRNAISAVLDRHGLGTIIDVTVRRFRRDGLTLPFSEAS